MNKNISFRHLTDHELTNEVHQLMASERQITARLLACLGEFDRRRMHLPLGYTSLFDYCVKSLRLTEHEALNRIEAARAIRKFPELLDRLTSGALSLTAVRLLAPHLTDVNYSELMQKAAGQNKEGIRLLIATLKPQPPVPAVVRKLPEPRMVPQPNACTSLAEPEMSLTELIAAAPPSAAPPSRRPVLAPLSAAHYKLQVTISASARARLQQIQHLMRHRLPSGDPAAIVEQALEVLHADLLKKKAAEVQRPRLGKAASDAKGRYIPASVRRAVFRRDHGECAFIADDGTTCGSTSGVEFHHLQPYAVGGEATVENIELRCRAHNGFEWTRHLDAESEYLSGR